MTWVWIIWVLGVLVMFAALLALGSTIPLMRRRTPDAADHPHAHGLPAEDITLTTQDGLTLGGWWIPADGDAQGTVIQCAGQNGSMDSDLAPAHVLHDAGFNVLMFDWRAHGRSEGETVTLGALEQLDLVAALDYAEQRRNISRVGVLGFSMGAGVALMTAAHDRRIAALVVDGAYPALAGLLAGWAARRQGFPGPWARALARIAVMAASLRANLQLYRANPIESAPHVTAPVLFVHTADDDFVTEADIVALRAAVGGPSELWIAPDANHREAFERHTAEYTHRVIDWFTRHLSGA